MSWCVLPKSALDACRDEVGFVEKKEFSPHYFQKIAPSKLKPPGGYTSILILGRQQI